MVRGVRKFLAVMLSATIIVAGSGLGGLLSSEMQHELGVEVSAAACSGHDGEGKATCKHGCASHLVVHLLSITEPRPGPMDTGRRDAPVMDSLKRLASSPPLSFFRPPRFSLT